MKVRLFPAKVLKYGSDSSTRIKAIANAKQPKKHDSPRNWYINCFLEAPTAFRMLISTARLPARAVDKLIKLKHAIVNINSAETAKI